MKVTPTAKSGSGQKAPAAANTGSNGQVTFSNMNTGLFALAITGGGPPALQTQNNDASTCVFSGTSSQLLMFGTSPPPKGYANANLTVPVENTYPAGTAALAVEAVDTTNTYKFETQVDLDGCGTSCTATNVVVPAWTNLTYTVTVNCVGVGGAAAASTTDGPGVQDGEPLATWTTAKITGATTDTTTEAVKCPQS